MPEAHESDETIEYYNRNAADFCCRTAGLDMSALYEPFLAAIPPRGRILDAGCGSGRDSLAFLERGYEVVSIDASIGMVEATSALTAQAARLMRFDEMQFQSEFDGIWACASLVHVRRTDLPDTLRLFIAALKPGGVWFISIKAGSGEAIRNGRLFSDYSQSEFDEILSQYTELRPIRIWTSSDLRPGKPDETWINGLVARGLVARRLGFSP